MDSSKLAEYIDQTRWLLNNGLVTDDVKNQLFFCGSVVHRDVAAVELDIIPETKLVDYKIYVDPRLIGKIEKYNVLSKSTSLFGMWRFKRLLKKEGSLDFQSVLGKFVRDFCGPKWSTRVQVIDFNKYVDAPGETGEPDGGSQQSDKLPDQ
jgi:hypothetical protein